jgi:hypothetical protein
VKAGTNMTTGKVILLGEVEGGGEEEGDEDNNGENEKSQSHHNFQDSGGLQQGCVLLPPLT